MKSILFAIRDFLNHIDEILFGGLLRLIGWQKSSYDAYRAGMLIFFSVLWFALVYVGDCLNWIVPKLVPLLSGIASGSGITGEQIPSALSDAFDVANTFFPLSEFFGCVAFLLPLWMLAVTIRAIKAWIPTLT